MTHPLEKEYGLSAAELLDAISKRFRAKVTLEGAVAEVQLGKIISALNAKGGISRYEEHDKDGQPDFSVWRDGYAEAIRIECKNVRDSDEAYREKGVIVAYKVETQKTRASQGDPMSRFYGIGQFEILAVCLGKKTRDWKSFLFIKTTDLERHGKSSQKLAVMHKVPLPETDNLGPWHRNLAEVLEKF